MRRQTLTVLLVLAGLFAAAGCETPPTYTDYDAFMTRPRPIVGGKPYVIEPPDTIQIIAPNAPEIHNASARLRPDGYITLYLLGDVFAAGKTPTQLAAEIEEKILKYYEDVTVQVTVTGFNSKVYYLAGEIGNGPRQYTGRDTVLDAVLRSGIRRTAWPEKCVVIRPNEEGQLIRRMTVNMRDMTERGDLQHNAVLEEGDIIFMPTNPIAQIGLHIQNLLSPVNPVIRTVRTPDRIGNAVE